MEEKLRRKLISLFNKKAEGSGCGGYREYVKPHKSKSRFGKRESVRGFYRNMPEMEYIAPHKNRSKYGDIYDVPAEIRNYGSGYIPAYKRKIRKGGRAPSAYNIFVGKKLKEGHTLKQAIQEYREMKGTVGSGGRRRKKGRGLLKLLL
jgi:hypothetical protein